MNDTPARHPSGTLNALDRFSHLDLPRPVAATTWSASGGSGRIDASGKRLAPEQTKRTGNATPGGARRYAARDVLDLYRHVQEGVIPAGHCVYALQRGTGIGREAVRVLRWARVVPAAMGGELRWQGGGARTPAAVRPLSKSVHFVVTPAPVDDPSVLIDARLEKRIDVAARLADRVSVTREEGALGADRNEPFTMRLRRRPKTEASRELEQLLEWVVNGRRHDPAVPRGGAGRMSASAAQARLPVSVARLDWSDSHTDETSSGVHELQMGAATDVGPSPSQYVQFASLHQNPAALPPVPTRGSAEVLKALQSLLQESLERASATHDADGSGAASRQRGMSALLPASLYAGYRHLQREMVAMTHTSRLQPKRRPIDVHDDDVLTAGIEDWIDQLCSWLDHEAGATPDDASHAERQTRIEALAWLYFVTRSEELNRMSLHKDIDELDDGTTRMASEVFAELDRYGLPRRELRALLAQRDVEVTEYSPRTVWRVMKALARMGALRGQRGKIVGIAANYVLQGLLRGLAPAAYAGVTQGGRFHFDAYSRYWAAAYIGSDLTWSHGQAATEKALLAMESALQRRWMQRAFYGGQDHASFEKMFNTLTRGREAGSKMIGDALGLGIPGLIQIGAAATVLSRFDPRLAATGMLSLPVMYLWARHNNRKMQRFYRESNEQIDRTAEHNRRYIDGAEDLQGLASLEDILHTVETQFDNERSLVRQVNRRKAWQWFWNYLPMELGALGTVAAGLQLALPAGEVLASTIAFTGLTYPIQRLARMYFDEFPRHMLEIVQLQDQVVGGTEIDMPGGPLEAARVPVSRLTSLDVEFRSVGFSVPVEHGHDKEIVRDVDFSIAQGECVTLIGPSGSGKSTLMRLLGGIHTPTAGEIAIGGIPREQIRQHGGDSLTYVMHYASQHSKFFPGTLFQNLSLDMPRARSDAELRRRREAVTELIERFGLESAGFGLDEAFPRAASGGQRVRFSLIRAALPAVLANDGKNAGILLIDEPTAGLDPASETRVIDFVQELNARGTTMLIITHNDRLAQSHRQVKLPRLSA